MLVEYVWVDHDGQMRSKTKVIYQKRPPKLEDLNLPFWHFNDDVAKSGGGKNDIVLKPQSVFPDPFRGGECIMVLCDTYNSDLTPLQSNTRHDAVKVFNVWGNQKPMYGMSQEFFLMEKNGPLGFANVCHSTPLTHNASDFYCGSGGNNAYGRECVESAFKRCILSGINVTGMHPEGAPAQWKINLCAEGIAAADQLVMMRYILNRTAEMHGYWINYSPKPMLHWRGSGCHVNFSTNDMRDDGGYSVIEAAIVKLEKAHQKHIDNYGARNDLRLMNMGGASLFDTFTHGVGEGNVSVRIPNETFTKKRGYFEDRRPGANMDPYVVAALILETSLS